MSLPIVYALALLVASRVGLAHRSVVVAPAETLAVATAGAGPVVVLIPGMIGGAFTWRQVAAGLVERGHAVVVVELLGTGGSGRPHGVDYSLQRQAERVRAVLDTLGVRSATIAAHGVAGSVALRLALLDPQRARRVVLLEGGAAERAGSPGVKRALAFAPLVKLFGGRRLLREKVRKGLIEASGDARWISDDVLDAYVQGPASDVGATLRVLAEMAEGEEPQHPLAARLDQLACPVLMLLGGTPHRSAPAPGELQLLGARIAGYRQLVIPGAGHYLQEERPDAVLQELSAEATD